MKTFKKGSYLSTEGSEDNVIFVLLSGKIGVYKNDIQVSEISEKGSIVGEMSVILNEPRTASLLAEEDTKVIEISADLDELFERYPDITKNILISFAKRLKKTTDDYFHLADSIEVDD